MNRRGFLTAAGALGAAHILGGKRHAAAAEQPNILFIMADDLGYADLGCYGQEVIRTPHIDAISKAGTRFTACYAGSPVCAPSRSVLMTGKHTGHTTVRGNFGVGGVVGLGGGKGRVSLRAEDVTVAEVLQGAGYVTGMTGKWGLGEPNTAGEPNRQGWDEWFGYLNQRKAHSYYPDFIWRNREKVMLPGNADGKQEEYTHDMFTDFALDFVRRHRGERFFLYVPYCIPHDRYELPGLGPYAELPWDENDRAYAAMVTRMDRDVGRMMALLDELGLAENTLVFFCSDNGAAHRWKRFGSSGPLRGKKRDMYEGGIRTPMVVRWPGKVPAGKVDDRPWYFADVLPTLAEAAGAKAPAGIDGISVLPALRGKAQDLKDRYLYWEFFEGGFKQAVRWRDWKAVRPGLGKALELYDLAEDLGETTDVARDHPRIVQQIETYLKTARTPSPEWPLDIDAPGHENL